MGGNMLLFIAVLHWWNQISKYNSSPQKHVVTSELNNYQEANLESKME